MGERADVGLHLNETEKNGRNQTVTTAMRVFGEKARRGTRIIMEDYPFALKLCLSLAGPASSCEERTSRGRKPSSHRTREPWDMGSSLLGKGDALMALISGD
jgi:hypothetical protein